MVVDKFYAIYEKPDGSNEIVDAFQAIKLKYKDKVVVTNPKEKCPFMDIETYLKVYPTRRKKDKGQPFYKYYPNEESPLKGRKSSLEYTQELKTFIRAFEEIKSFKIEELGWERSGKPIKVFPKRMKKLQRIDTTESFVVLKFLVELEETFPYSYYYKYNGVLGLEFSVTSQPAPIKSKELERKGIPLFKADIQFPRWVDVPEEFEDEAQFEKVAAEVRKTFEDTNYRLQGEFINEAINFPEYKEKNNILNNFERQCDELKEEKKRLKNKIDEQKQTLSDYKKQTENLQSLIKKEQTALEEYRSKINQFKKIKEQSEQVKSVNDSLLNKEAEMLIQLENKNEQIQKLTKEISQLKTQNSDLSNTTTTLKDKLLEKEEQVNELVIASENKSFFKKLFNRKK
ncbi:hypothetical protein [Enterococcus faecalis]|uniref:hypothetical protein n=1 Tax=Enterococcus faecalis TaxID=1351 RepID=UPI00338EFAFA